MLRFIFLRRQWSLNKTLKTYRKGNRRYESTARALMRRYINLITKPLSKQNSSPSTRLSVPARLTDCLICRSLSSWTGKAIG